MAPMRYALLALLLAALALPVACADEPRPPAVPDPSLALRESLARRIAETPPGPDRVALEIEHAVAVLKDARAPEGWHARLADATEALGALRAEKQAAGDVEAEAQVRVALGKHLSMSGAHDAARAELDWVLGRDPESPFAPAALTEKASDHFREGDFAGSKALLEEVLRRYPDSAEAARVPAGIENCERRLEQGR